MIFSISGTSKVNEKYTTYSLRMQTQLITWDVERRFSEFHNLHQAISGRKKNIKGGAREFPKFPPKKLKSMNDQVIDERKDSLSKYMNELL